MGGGMGGGGGWWGLGAGELEDEEVEDNLSKRGKEVGWIVHQFEKYLLSYCEIGMLFEKDKLVYNIMVGCFDKYWKDCWKGSYIDSRQKNRT